MWRGFERSQESVRRGFERRDLRGAATLVAPRGGWRGRVTI